MSVARSEMHYLTDPEREWRCSACQQMCHDDARCDCCLAAQAPVASPTTVTRAVCWKCGARQMDPVRDIWATTMATPACDEHEPMPTIDELDPE